WGGVYPWERVSRILAGRPTWGWGTAEPVPAVELNPDYLELNRQRCADVAPNLTTEEAPEMFRFIHPGSDRQLSMRMLYQPAGDGTFLHACEADSWRALVAAMLDDPAYESAGPEDRLVERLRLADDVKLLAAIDDRALSVADHDGPETVNISSDEPLVRSLDALGFVSLEPHL